MSHIIDISDDSLKKVHLSENNICNPMLDKEFQTIKSNKITNIYRNEKFFYKNNKIPPIKELEKKIHKYFFDLYYHDKYFYRIKVIDDILNNNSTHLVAEFKDYLIMGDDSEFLQRRYNLEECKRFLPTLLEYYKSCSVIFPNYVVLQESKYIFKNIRRKQKVIDNQQEQDDKREKIKNGEINLDENDVFFTTKAFNSILNQTNTSNVKLFFGINSKSKNNDSEETLNDIFKKILQAENKALIIKNNYILKKKNIKNTLKTNYEIKTKINEYKMKNANNIKLKKGRNANNNVYLNTKLSYQKIKNLENNNKIRYERVNNSKIINASNINEDIKIIYSNKNQRDKTKNLIKLNTSKKHIRSNTCVFDTDVNEKSYKKFTYINRNDSSKKKMFTNGNSNKKLSNFKERKKKEIITNKEFISKIMEKIKNSKSAVFQGYNSFHTHNKKKFMVNIKENPTINTLSTSSTVKINSYIKKMNAQPNGMVITINESNSTPNIIKLQNNINNNKKIKVNNAPKIKVGNKPGFKMIKVNSNLNISPLNEIDLKKHFYYNTNNNSNMNFYYNNNYSKNILTTNTIKNKNQNQKKIKKNEKDQKKFKNYNLNFYKVSPNSITQKYINNSILPSNKTVTISNIKPYNEPKYGSIKVIKKQKTVETKKKQKTDINNNININININSNNIYNNTNQFNNNSNNSNNITNNIQSNSTSINNIDKDKKKYINFYKQSNINFQRNESHPIIKKILLSSSSNRNVYNFKKNIMFEDMNKKKNIYLNSNTLTFAGSLTTRNSNNGSKIKYTMKSKAGNEGKVDTINNNKFKKQLFNKKDTMVLPKKMIQFVNNQKENNNKIVKKNV